MKRIFFLLAFAAWFFTSSAQSVSNSDLQIVAGSWTGQLTYLDYTSNKSESIKAALSVENKKEGEYQLNFSYPNEPGYSHKEKYRIGKNGQTISNIKVIERTEEAGLVKIVLEEKGKDGNDHKSATFHHVLLISKSKLTLTKLVKFDGEEKFFQRNQYLFNR